MDQAAKTNTPTSAYISNPLLMISPSASALGVNLSSLLGMFGLMLSPFPVMIIASAVAFGLRDSGIGLIISLTAGLLALLAFVVLLLVSLPTYAIILIASVKGQKIGLRAALAQARMFIVPSLGLSLLTALAVIGGLLLFIIPGLIFIAWFSLSQYAMVAENLGVIESMKRSKQLVKGRVWEMWSLIMLPSMAGVIPFVGGLINFVLSIALIPSMALRYVQLVGSKPEDRPKVHWSNYALIIVAIVAGVALAGASVASFQEINQELSSPTYTY